jgi:hypothetical protein
MQRLSPGACSRNAADASSRLSCSVGFVLIALLFVADATLEKGPPAIVTSDRIGLPEHRRLDTIRTLTNGTQTTKK